MLYMPLNIAYFNKYNQSVNDTITDLPSNKMNKSWHLSLHTHIILLTQLDKV